MKNCTDIYNTLRDIEQYTGCDLEVYYTKDSRDNHMFCLNGRYESINSTSECFFQSVSNFKKENPNCKIIMENSGNGFHIKLKFDEDKLKGDRPESDGKIDTIRHNGINNKEECSNCLASTSNLPYSSATIYYQTPPGEKSKIRNYNLCVDCRPGHYDDVIGAVDRFLVENNSIVKIGFKKRDEFGEDFTIEWKYIENSSPYTKDTAKIIEKRILESDHIQ